MKNKSKATTHYPKEEIEKRKKKKEKDL